MRIGAAAPEGSPARSASRLEEGEMGEGPTTVRVRPRKARYYAAIGAVVVVGAGVAVGTSVAGANAAPNTVSSVAVPQTSPASSNGRKDWRGFLARSNRCCARPV